MDGTIPHVVWRRAGRRHCRDIGCHSSVCANPAIPHQTGHNHLGLSCGQHARCRPASDRRSAQPDLGPTNPCSESSRRHRQHCFANCSRISARRIHALHAGPVQLRGTAGSDAQCADPAAARLCRDRVCGRKSHVHCCNALGVSCFDFT